MSDNDEKKAPDDSKPNTKGDEKRQKGPRGFDGPDRPTHW